MPDRPTQPDRELDNAPPPLLTYDGPSEGKAYGAEPSRESRRMWVAAVLVLLLVMGGYARWELTRGPASGQPFELTPPPSMGPGDPAPVSVRTLIPLNAVDTSVTPGAEVQLAVRAGGADDRPAADVLVRFQIEIGATSREEEVFTNSSGLASLTVQMPPRPVEVVVRASSAPLDTPPVLFRVTARTGPPTTLSATTGDGQEADAGDLLPERLGVEVLDPDGVPVPGVQLFFEVATGHGMVAPSRALTDSSGRASAIWRLGITAGPQALVVSADEFTASLTFTATALPAEQTTSAVATPDLDTVSSAAPVSVFARDFAIGGANVCVIRGGTVTCRGANDRGQGIVGGLPGSRAVAAGLFHACALDGSGIASCWGANEAGQLGDGTSIDRAAPVRVATDHRFSVLAAGVSHTCGLGAGGQALCWGANLGGQLGDGSRSDRAEPVPVANSTAFRLLVAGWNHTCALTAAGSVQCWGLNRDGAVGDGSTLDRLTPVSILDRVEDLSAGSAHTCAVRQGRVLCWGANSNGQLGVGSLQSRAAPAMVDGLRGRAMAVAAGAAHTCALLTDGTAHCWGQNLHGQLGNGSTAGAALPQRVQGGLTFARIHAGGGLTCGVTDRGDEYCWGLNQNGELGDGTRTSRSVPTLVTSA